MHSFVVYVYRQVNLVLFTQKLTMSQRSLSNIHPQLHGLEREAIPQFPTAEVSTCSLLSIVQQFVAPSLSTKTYSPLNVDSLIICLFYIMEHQCSVALSSVMGQNGRELRDFSMRISCQTHFTEQLPQILWCPNSGNKHYLNKRHRLFRVGYAK